MDQKLFFLINRQWTSSALDLLMASLSSFDFWMPIFAVLIVLLGVFGGFRERAFLLTLLMTVLLTDCVLTNSLKHAVNRPRPRQVQAVRLVDFAPAHPRLLAIARPLVVVDSQPETGKIAGRSFPSGHTGNNFAAATVLFAFYRRRGWLYYAVAAGVGYSRVYTGAHWPSDVLASVFLGIAMGMLGLLAAQTIWRTWGARVAPVVYGAHPTLFPGCGAQAGSLCHVGENGAST